MKHNVLLLSLVLCIFSASAQNTFPVLSMQVDCTPTANYMTVDSVVHYDSTTVFAATMQIVVDDTTNISSIEVTFGKSANEVLLQKSFTFDVSGSLGNNTSFFRSGYNITLGLGEFADISLFYADMQITRADNSISQLFTYHQ
jgi:hypothetical protein